MLCEYYRIFFLESPMTKNAVLRRLFVENILFYENLESPVLAASYFRPEGLSSPQLRLTAVFGMGTGVAITPNHQNAGFKNRF